MNTDQAKRIPLADIMALMGHDVKVVERGSTEYKYLSPFRHETEPSFNVNLVKNAWYDFGLAQGGNALDFALAYVEHTGKGSSVSDALKWLDDLVGRVGGQIKIKHQVVVPEVETPTLELLSVSEVKSKAIFNYLENKRKLDPSLIPIYLKQVRYKNHSNGKTFFAYGIENLSGGYEIRVATDDYPFKSAVGGRDISLIPGVNTSTNSVNVFEGTTDFLSLLTMMKANRLSGDALLMHSLTSYKRALQVIKEKGYRVINLFLDNNQPGKDHTAAFKRDLEELEVNIQSELFMPYIDINEALKASAIPAKLMV